MAEMKDVLYLETDEEITTAIDKMLGMKGESVSIVVPKRSGLLLSIVNLKLLKKAADDAGKKLVLVTGDRTATHLAGKVGLAVAASLKAEPVIPEAPNDMSDDTSEIVEGDEGEYEGGAPAVSAVPEGMGPVKLDDTPADEEEPEAEEPETAPTKSRAERKDKPDFAKPMLVRTPIKEDEAAATLPKKPGVKVPNFSAFQKRTLIAGGVIALLVVAWLLNFFLESAKVTLYVQGQQVAASFDFTVDPATSSSNYGSAILSGQALTSTKTLTGNFKATGTKDVGTKASGTMTVNNCFDSNSHTFPAGTQFVSGGGLVFISTADVTVPGGSVNVLGCNKAGTATVSVEANANGDQYNLSGGTKFNIPSVPSSEQPYIYGTGSQMSGGTTKTVNVVQQSDIDGAKAQALQADLSGAQQALEGKTPTGFTPLGQSFVQTPGTVTSSAQVGDQADNGTVTIQVTYSELAVNKADYKQLIQTQEQKIVGAQNQIYDDGSSSAKITAGQAASPGGKQDFHFAATAAAGQRLNSADIAKNLAGKKLGEASDYANQQSGVQQVAISISPGWDGNMPAFANHIQIIIKVANGG